MRRALTDRFGMWVAGARPRTLPAAIVPVAVGAAAATGAGGDIPGAWWRAAAALVVALGLQVGVNFANDYSDGIRGTDRAGQRVGPVRLVGSGAVPPGRVRLAAFGAFGVAGVAGLTLAVSVAWWLVLVGAACVAAAWGYTGGPRPYGYVGFGEVFVFVFFGLVATAGTSFVLLERVQPLAVAAAVPVGLWAVALLVANNLRDITGDAASGKLTLAVRLGDRPTRVLYVMLLVVSYGTAAALSVSGRAGWAALVGVPLAVRAVRVLRRARTPQELIGVLAATGRLQLVSGLCLAAGLALTG